MEIAVISGKGGTGKSSISAAFATMGGNVVLADCDVDAANLYLLFNPSSEEEEVYVAGHKAVIDYDLCTDCQICMEFCRFDAISVVNKKLIISEPLCDGCFLCSRVCPEKAIRMVQNDRSRMYSGSFRNGRIVYGRLAPGEENSGKLVNRVRDKAKQVAKETGIKTIIIDGPPGIGCPVISSITGVDKVVIVTEPTISGLSDMQRAVEVSGKFGFSPFVIINKADLNHTMSEEIKQWCSKNNVSLAGEIEFDSNITEAMVKGLSIIEFDRELGVSKSIRALWAKISEKPDL
jgi:MinD superfamily P-loop ATPase